MTPNKVLNRQPNHFSSCHRNVVSVNTMNRVGSRVNAQPNTTGVVSLNGRTIKRYRGTTVFTPGLNSPRIRVFCGTNNYPNNRRVTGNMLVLRRGWGTISRILRRVLNHGKGHRDHRHPGNRRQGQNRLRRLRRPRRHRRVSRRHFRPLNDANSNEGSRNPLLGVFRATRLVFFPNLNSTVSTGINRTVGRANGRPNRRRRRQNEGRTQNVTSNLKGRVRGPN